MKKLVILLIVILVGVLCSVGVYFYNLTPVSKVGEEVKFTAGGSTKKVINDLYDAKLIRSKFFTLVYAKLNKNMVIKAGTYDLDRSNSTQEIFKKICGNGAIKDTIVVTFTEGKRIVDYAKVISDNFPYTEEEVLNVINDKEYIKELINKYSFLTDNILKDGIYYPLEGYLFPDTYEFYKTASIKSIIEKLLDKMGKVLDNYSTSFDSSSYSIHEILTMASIIESESKFKEDREIVSQVIYKRLSINMSLGMDVTSAYGYKVSLKEFEEMRDKSPVLNDNNAYNTRRTDFIGLPVGPICSPRKLSIEAALNPSDTNYIYFYADIYGMNEDGTCNKELAGKLHFANNQSEFNAIKAKYSRKCR